jgi:hypothetical protein
MVVENKRCRVPMFGDSYLKAYVTNLSNPLTVTYRVPILVTYNYL